MTVQSRTSRTEIDALEMSQKVEAHTKTGRNGNYRCRAEPPRAENVFTPAGEAPVLGCLTGYRLCVSVCVCMSLLYSPHVHSVFCIPNNRRLHRWWNARGGSHCLIN